MPAPQEATESSGAVADSVRPGPPLPRPGHLSEKEQWKANNESRAPRVDGEFIPTNVIRRIAAEAYQLGFKRGKEEGLAEGRYDALADAAEQEYFESVREQEVGEIR